MSHSSNRTHASVRRGSQTWNVIYSLLVLPSSFFCSVIIPLSCSLSIAPSCTLWIGLSKLFCTKISSLGFIGLLSNGLTDNCVWLDWTGVSPSCFCGFIAHDCIAPSECSMFQQTDRYSKKRTSATPSSSRTRKACFIQQTLLLIFSSFC